ncbi:MAG: uracil-DNA glycosylase [Bacteroidota bacterium]|nr:uracil-DNA glycosylase [Bacteroidota bacterium]
MEVKIEGSWKHLLNQEFNKPYFIDLIKFVKNEYKEHEVFPPGKEIFNAFNFCPFDSLKVVIIGQDPYHGKGQAHGLCFSVREGVRVPPSLANIFKEIKDDLNKEAPKDGSLERWARQGALLLNAALTVRSNQAGSHQARGWEQFTDTVIKVVSDNKEGVVFMLWGAYAQKKSMLIDADKHLVLQSAHPSPFSAHKGFLGNKHFSNANAYLKSNGKEEIDW